MSGLRERTRQEVTKVAAGQVEVVDHLVAAAVTEALLTALLARGHVLIEGVPGVATTTLVKAFSATLG